MKPKQKTTIDVEGVMEEFDSRFFIAGKNAYGEEKPLLFPAKVEVRDWLHATLTTLLNQAEEEKQKAVEEERERIKNIILRRTEIPKGARNPTRDAVVILGEELVELISQTPTISSDKK